MKLHCWPEGTVTTHGPDECDPEYPCAIHRPSDHPLNAAPMLYRIDRYLLERTCEHGIGHPDPDDHAYAVRRMGETAEGRDIHGCDGCCRGKPLNLAVSEQSK